MNIKYTKNITTNNQIDNFIQYTTHINKTWVLNYKLVAFGHTNPKGCWSTFSIQLPSINKPSSDKPSTFIKASLSIKPFPPPPSVKHGFIPWTILWVTK